MVKKDVESRVFFEKIDITAKPETEAEESSFTPFLVNTVPLVYVDGKLRIVALHSVLVTSTKDPKFLVWRREMENIVALLQKYRRKNDARPPSVFADANMILDLQKQTWADVAKMFEFKHFFGTESDRQLSFYGQPWDKIPDSKFDSLNPHPFGFAHEYPQERMVVPISLLDGAMSDHPFNLVYPDVRDGVLKPLILPFSSQPFESQKESTTEALRAFQRLHQENATRIQDDRPPLAAFDHVAFGGFIPSA